MILLTILLWSLAATQESSPVQDPVAPVREALEKRQDQQALVLLKSLSASSPDLYRANNLDYLEGVVLSRLGRSEEALEKLESLLDPDFLLQDQLLAHLIRVTAGLPMERRRPFFEEYLENWKSHPNWAEIAYEYACLLDAEGRFVQAKAWYDRVWRLRKKDLSRQAALGHALLHFKTDEETEGIRDLARLLREQDADDVALEAVRTLEGRAERKSLSEIELKTRAQVYMNNRDGQKARTYLDRLIGAFPGSVHLDEYGYLKGRSFVIEDRFEEAARAYEETYTRYPDSSWGLLCGYQLGNTLLRNKEYARAARQFRDFLNNHPGNRYIPRVYFNLAETYLWMGDPAGARKVALEGISQTRPAEHRTFQYQLARIALDEQRWEEALGSLRKLDHLSSAQLPSGVTREEIYFLIGHCLEKLGRADPAEEAFRVAVSGSPNYFAHLSRGKVGHSDPVRPFSGADTWPLKRLSPRGFYHSVEQVPGSPRIPSVERARELLFLGLEDEAALEINRTSASNFPGGRIDRLYNLAFYAQRGGLASLSVQAAESLRRTVSGVTWPEESPPSLQKLYFPRHYWAEIGSAAGEFGVEPELVLSLIRQESVFQADAKSPAAARGLMQFMVETAREKASQLGLPVPAPEDLYQAELSIRLGTFYLSQLIAEFDGSLEKALAAYNSGAYNVRRWTEKLPDPTSPEIFVSNIGYRETKLYVLKVLGNYYGYRSVYGRSSGDD